MTRFMTDRPKHWNWQMKRVKPENRWRQLAWAEICPIFSSVLDVNTRLNQFANVMIKYLADLCAVNLLQVDGTMKNVVLVHQDAAKRPRNKACNNSCALNNNLYSVIQWLQTNKQSAPAPDVGDPSGQIQSIDVRHAWQEHWGKLESLRNLLSHSLMIVPLMTQDHSIGEVILWRATHRLRFTDTDRQMAEALTQRAAIAVDHASAYQEACKLNESLERRMAQGTAQLRESVAKLSESHEKLRKLAARQRKAIEEEQTRISREVHDQLGQLLTALKMDVRKLQRQLHPYADQNPAITS